MRKVILAGGVVVFMASGFAIWHWWPIMICCLPNGTDCYPVDQAQDCPGGRFVSECECPTTLPDGSTECEC